MPMEGYFQEQHAKVAYNHASRIVLPANLTYTTLNVIGLSL